MQAILALADAAPDVDWRGDMRHLPAVGALPTPPVPTSYLVVKQDDNGATFVVTTAELPWLTPDLAIHAHVAPRKIGARNPPTSQDIPTFDAAPYAFDTDDAREPPF